MEDREEIAKLIEPREWSKIDRNKKSGYPDNEFGRMSRQWDEVIERQTLEAADRLIAAGYTRQPHAPLSNQVDEGLIEELEFDAKDCEIYAQTGGYWSKLGYEKVGKNIRKAIAALKSTPLVNDMNASLRSEGLAEPLCDDCEGTGNLHIGDEWYYDRPCVACEGKGFKPENGTSALKGES